MSAPPRESGSCKYRGYAQPRGELLGTDAEHHDAAEAREWFFCPDSPLLAPAPFASVG